MHDPPKQLDTRRDGETDVFVHMRVCREIDIYLDNSGKDQNSLVPGNLEHIRVVHGGRGASKDRIHNLSTPQAHGKELVAE